MSHAIQILTFDEKTSKQAIQAECDEWGSANCDPMERGGCRGGLASPVHFTDRVFDSLEDAEDYLYSTAGNYSQTAVRYKVYPETKPCKAIESLNARIAEYRQKISVLNQPHYAGTKQATVKCKVCGSTLATRFCGKTYSNSCPVCGTDLRPQSIHERLEKYESTIDELEKRLKAETAKQNRKNESKVRYFWAVCCEVHC